MTRSERLMIGLGCLGAVVMLCMASAGGLWLVTTGQTANLTNGLERIRGSVAQAPDAAPAAGAEARTAPAAGEQPAAAEDASPGDTTAPAREQSRARDGSGTGQPSQLRTLERNVDSSPREPLPLRGVAVEGDGVLTRLYEQVNPGVVSILVQQSVTMGNQEFSQTGGGSGFVYDGSHLITNNHVIDGADSIEVVFFDGSRREGRVVGADAYSDLAVVAVDEMPASARALPLEDDFGSLKVGQPAVAIGAPFGRANSMTYGILSALGRTIPADLDPGQPGYGIPQTIQTDAAINPGNSGGPLLNLSGEVIGINAQINTTNQAGGVPGNSGVGFSIPASIVAKVAPALIETGKMTWSFLGVSGLPEDRFTVEVAKANGLSEPIGAYILGVPADGPSAGILRGIDEPASNAQQLPLGGDIIIGIDDQPVQSFDDLLAYIAIRTEPGQTVELKLLRGGEEVTERVTVAERK